MKKRIVSWLLSVAMIVGLIPASAVTALASEPEAETVSDTYISVSVSRKNGGFTIKTGSMTLPFSRSVSERERMSKNTSLAEIIPAAVMLR